MRLVLAPLKKELESLVSVLNGGEKNAEGYLYKDLQFVVGGLGKVDFAISTIKYTNLYKPTEVFAVGSCGSLKADLSPLDLVVVEKVIEHDFDMSFFKISELMSSSKNFPDLKRVTCASGDKSILSSSDKASLLEKVSADIVTWESAGFFKAAISLGVPFTEVRVITDAADDGALKDFKKNLSLGMQKIGQLFK